MALEYSSSSSLLRRLIITPCFFIFILFLLYSISLFQVTFTSASTPITSLLKVEQDQEALALLTWKAMTCHKSGSVSNLELYSCGLRGTLHNLNFSSLPNLLTLELSTNNLIGPIPPSIGNLRNLTTLYLFENKLSGSIPQEIGLLTSLNDLDLATNSLTGPIPPSIGNLRNLASLYLYTNKLSGSIPQEIGLLRSLNDLQLSTNNLIGPILLP
ncbi:hypothetical protein AAG906_026383 [Vitis piasezkii]